MWRFFGVENPRRFSGVEWIGARLYGCVDVDDFGAAFVVGGLGDKCVEGLDMRSWGLGGFACGRGMGV